MSMFIKCSVCRNQLELPRGASVVRCSNCQPITRVTDPHTLQTPLVHGRKRAVICGILYKGTEHELKGCTNDANSMRHLLVDLFKFPESSILMLNEEESDPCRIPTKHNIRQAINWLVQDLQPGDSVVFYYSGHGGRQKNTTGDEIDGHDETLCPVDFETQGMIVDDEINATLVKPIPHGVKLHAIIDACHSGTMLDLPFLYRMHRVRRNAWEDHRPKSRRYMETSRGEVISFSGCHDHQKSEETPSLSGVAPIGAMTNSFIQAIVQQHATTYLDILNSMRTTIRKKEGHKHLTSLLDYGRRKRQEPQLTASEPFDVCTKRFSL